MLADLGDLGDPTYQGSPCDPEILADRESGDAFSRASSPNFLRPESAPRDALDRLIVDDMDVISAHYFGTRDPSGVSADRDPLAWPKPCH